MKILTTSSFMALGLVVATSAMAQMDRNTPMAQPAKTTVAAADATAMGEGQVKNINKARGTVTLQHGALPNGMPPMTMAYKVKDATWLDQMKVGQKIRFATDPADGGMTVLRYELVK